LSALEAAATPNGSLRLGTFRSIWSAPEVDASPALKFLSPRQRAELGPEDAARLGIGHGDHVIVGAGGSAVHATAHLRAATPAGSIFLETGTPSDSASSLTSELVEVRKA